MKLPLLFKSIAAETRTSSSPWPWPSCKQPKTLSFRAGCTDIFKTINSAYLDPPSETQTPDESWFTNSSSESASFSTASDDEAAGGDLTETVIRGVRSERLFFEPGDTNSILEEAKVGEPAPFKESTVMSLDSRDPYADFRESMAEMVAAHGIKEWDNLEELLGWYLRVNGKHNHQYIVGAFIDLLVGLAVAAPISNKCASPPISTNSHLNHQNSPSSIMSLYTSFSSPSSSELDDDDDDNAKEIQEIEDEDELMDVHVV